MITSPGCPFKIRYTQNYLKSHHLIEHLLDRSSIGPSDFVVEIGAGKGKVTKCLAARCRSVIAVEMDPALVASLRRVFASEPRLTIYQGDFLTFPLPIEPYKVFANIPFNITTAIVTRLTRGERPPEDCYLVMQREASDRFCGKPRESVYALLLKPWFEPTVVHRFSREDFSPVPRVDVAMLRLRKRAPPLVAPSEARLYRDFIVHSFTQGRTGRDGIRVGGMGKRQSRRFLEELGINPYSAPTSIPFEQWLKVFHRYLEIAQPRDWQDIIGAERLLARQQTRLRKRHRTSLAHGNSGQRLPRSPSLLPAHRQHTALWLSRG